jgi:hypothetical protein
MKIRVLHVASGKIIDIDATWSFERRRDLQHSPPTL